jgi:hypothetical protein
LKKAVAELWARRTLATQTALIEASRLRVDAHQLAWALATDVIANGDRAVRPESEHDELYEAALDAFFSEQSEDGSWRLYEPLFHYFQAGNAYCYTFETLAELLRPALRTKDGRVWRDRLRPYASKLLNAWHYAASTAIETDAGRRGWCSGHHPHRTDPEAWATAGVFSYLENLRCLVGHWAAEKAQETLRVQRPRWATPELARAELADRGETWPVLDKPTAGRQLASMFLHPLEATRSVQDTIDPDQPLVMEARSAVLFGPPGGSKTTMVEALAGALDWRYVEVHASHFLSRGMDLVPSRADEIFSRLMELDRCVILFDEIDELIRMRQDSGSDPFGRFLTTSMLPKLARLWEQQRVLFFVATNAIDAADAAIKRSQRFDASIFVTPPAFGKKVSELTERLGSEPPSALTEAAVQEALDAPSGMSGHPLGVFALLRWDQIAELAHGLRVELQSGLATDAASADQALEKVLAVMGDKLAELEWRIEAKPEGAGESPKDPFALFAHYAAAERLDYRNRAMLRICGQPSPLPSGWKEFESDDRYIIITPEVEAALKRAGDAWELEGGSWHATDGGGLFSFALRSPTGAAHGSEASS